jgi:uncharacterized protein YvpB
MSRHKILPALLIFGSLMQVCSGGALLLDVPFVEQIKAGCGSAAIAMIVQYWGRLEPRVSNAAIDTERINRLLPPSPGKGISGRELKRYLQEHGFDVFIFNGELQDLEQHLNKGRPLVVCLGLRGRNSPFHYAVVVGLDDKDVVLNDAARGKLFREDRGRFLRAWNVTGNWALLAVPLQIR